MPFDVTALRARAQSAFAGFTSGQKAMLGIAVVAVLAAGLFFTSWAGKPSLTPLYTDLETSDAAAVTEELTSRGISYQLADGGRTVLVPRADVYDLRLGLSAAGLPTGGRAGYALLDKQGITASEFRQRVDYQRALEGELSRTIEAIDDVEGATVHLVMPKEDLFADDERHASASVLLRTRRGATLAAGQVQAVVHLVSSSVEGLTPETVTVADATGRVLSASGEDGVAAAAGDARAQQTNGFEQQLGSSIRELLEPLVGTGKAIVRVKADLDFSQRSTTTERFEPAEGAPTLTEVESQERYDGTGGAVGGILGPDALPVDGGGETSYEKSESQRSFAVGKVTEQVKAAPGTIRRMSVAVLLDGKVGNRLDQAEVRDLVAAAAGIDADRGDTVEVSTMAFDESAAQAADEALDAADAAERRSELVGLLRQVLTVVVVGLFLLVAWRRSARPRRQVLELPADAATIALAPSSPVALEGPDDVDLALDAGDGVLAPAAALPAAVGAPVGVQAEIAQLVERQPDEVAQLLRGWLADRRS